MPTTLSARQPRRCLVGAVCLIAVLVLPGGAMVGRRNVAAQNAQEVDLRAWECPGDVDRTSADPAYFAETCTEPAAGLSFDLDPAGDDAATRRTTQDDGRPRVPWSFVRGAFTIRGDVGGGASVAVFCTQDGETAEVEVEDNTISWDLPAGSALTCAWYVAPAEAVASPAATPAATEAPATAAPVATAPDPIGTPVATETPAEPDGEPTAIVVPEGMPREVNVGGELFGLDRAVPLDRQDLERVGRNGDALLYATSALPPLAAVYANVPPRSTSPLGRYLPEHLGDPFAVCHADSVTPPVGNVALGETSYAFAGYELDLTLDNLVPVADAVGMPVYAESSAAPFAELFIDDGFGLMRFVVLAGDGRPATAIETLAFAGQEFAFVGDATASVDPGALSKLGCAGAFSVHGAGVVSPPFGVVYVLVGGAFLQFEAE